MKLDALIDQILLITKEWGYAEGTWKNAIRNGRFSSLRQFFEDKGTDEFNIGIVREYMTAMQKRYENGEISYGRCTHLKKQAAWVIEVYETGDLQWKNHGKSKIRINYYFENVLREYILSKGAGKSKGSIATLKSVIMQLLDYLHNIKAYDDFSCFVYQDAHGFIEFIAQRYKSRLDNIVFYVKHFLIYLYEQNILSSDFSKSLQSPIQKRVRVLPCLSHNDTNKILAQPDRNTQKGKRDFAILVLARDTGLRRGDIANLKITDFDWRTGALTIIQNKTQNPLTLPLEPTVEYAVADYILNGRPKSNANNVFLRHHAPHVGLSPQSIGIIFRDCMLKAGIEHVPYDGKSIHALRRSIASWMLESEVSLETVSQVLGQKDMNSAKRYLSFDDANLKKCALSLHGIEVKKGGLV